MKNVINVMLKKLKMGEKGFRILDLKIENDDLGFLFQILNFKKVFFFIFSYLHTYIFFHYLIN